MSIANAVLLLLLSPPFFVSDVSFFSYGCDGLVGELASFSIFFSLFFLRFGVVRED